MAKFLKADIVVVPYFKPETQETSEVLVIFQRKEGNIENRWAF